MKFWQFDVSLYSHIFANFGGLTLIFNKMALFFSRSTYRLYCCKFLVSASQIALTSSLMTSDCNTQPQSTGLWGLRVMLESYHKLQ